MEGHQSDQDDLRELLEQAQQSEGLAIKLLEYEQKQHQQTKAQNSELTDLCNAKTLEIESKNRTLALATDKVDKKNAQLKALTRAHKAQIDTLLQAHDVNVGDLERTIRELTHALHAEKEKVAAMMRERESQQSEEERRQATSKIHSARFLNLGYESLTQLAHAHASISPSR